MNRTMKFGLGLISMQTHDEIKATHRDLYAQNIDYVKLAESVGFHSAWISEHHFLPDGYNPSSLVVASAFASATEKIRIGTAALLLPLHNPVRIAEDAAVVGRLTFVNGHGGDIDTHRRAVVAAFDGAEMGMFARVSLHQQWIQIEIIEMRAAAADLGQ